MNTLNTTILMRKALIGGSVTRTELSRELERGELSFVVETIGSRVLLKLPIDQNDRYPLTISQLNGDLCVDVSDQGVCFALDEAQLFQLFGLTIDECLDLI